MATHELMTLDEASDYLRLKRDTLLVQVRQNQVPYRRIGKKIVFHRQTLRLWVIEGLKGPEQFVRPIRRMAEQFRRRLALVSPPVLGSPEKPLTPLEKRMIARSRRAVRSGRIVPFPV